MISVLFDDNDIFYLANSLTTKQLRAEIHHAEVRAAVAEVVK